MARLKELKEKYSMWDISVIDILSGLDKTGTNKYTELFLKSIQNRHNYFLKGEFKHEIDWFMNRLNEWFDLGLNNENDINDSALQYIKYKLLNEFMHQDDFLKIKKFIDYSERKIIKTDINQLNTIEDVDRLISLADVKNIEKELSKDVIIDFKNEDWLLLRPLTYESSLKYGASTKWCTASKDSPEHFFRYSERGVLIYCINLKTGVKFGFFREIPQNINDTNYELSFWDTTDNRVDSMVCQFSSEVISHLINVELKSNKVLSNGKWDESFYRNSYENIKHRVNDSLTPVEMNRRIYEELEMMEDGTEPAMIEESDYNMLEVPTATMTIR